eukprot:767990-Hanusia_phi.AAC.2
MSSTCDTSGKVDGLTTLEVASHSWQGLIKKCEMSPDAFVQVLVLHRFSPPSPPLPPVRASSSSLYPPLLLCSLGSAPALVHHTAFESLTVDGPATRLLPPAWMYRAYN